MILPDTDIDIIEHITTKTPPRAWPDINPEEEKKQNQLEFKIQGLFKWRNKYLVIILTGYSEVLMLP